VRPPRPGVTKVSVREGGLRREPRFMEMFGLARTLALPG
jgi:hypothetical protein